MIVLLCALPAEAAPLVDAFSLAPDPAPAPFRRYLGDGLLLGISGVGADRASFATTWLAEHAESPPSAFLNIGIAGHARLAPGTFVVAHTVTWAATGRRFHPGMLFDVPARTTALITVPAPVTDYPEDACVDMEAGAVCAAATRFVSPDFVHAAKIVSDNAETGIGIISRTYVSNLVAGAADPLSRLIDEIRSALAAGRDEIPDRARRVTEELGRGMHFTVTQRVQCERLLTRLLALTGVDDAAVRLAGQAGADTRRFIAALEGHVAKLPLAPPR